MFQVKLRKGSEATYYQGSHVQSTELFDAELGHVGYSVEVCPGVAMLEIPRDGEKIYIMDEKGHTVDAFQWPPLTAEERAERRRARRSVGAPEAYAER